MLVADYGKEGAADWQRVVYDPDAGTVTFYNCYQSKRFFLVWGADPEFTCRVSELRAAYWNYVPSRFILSVLVTTWTASITTACPKSYFGKWELFFVTPAGTARLPQEAVGIDGVRSALIGGLVPESRHRWYEHPAAKFVLLNAFVWGAAILGILLIVKTGVLDYQWPVEVKRTVIVVYFVIISSPILITLLSWWRPKSRW
jgi:hypothetical protein